jgi:hypothetical protein
MEIFRRSLRMKDLEKISQELLAAQLKARFEQASQSFEQENHKVQALYDSKLSLNKLSLINIYNKHGLNHGLNDKGFEQIPKGEFARIAKILVLWGIPVGIIKTEGPAYVRKAVDITLSYSDEIKTTPKKYFNGVLDNLKKQKSCCY